MKKKIFLVLLLFITLLTITGCKGRGYKLLVKEETALTNLRLAITESETYGASTLTYEDISELENMIKNYNQDSEWFSPSALTYSGYGKIEEDKKYKITSLCDGNYCATFKMENDKGKYILEDYKFEKSSNKENRIYIVNEISGEASQVRKYDMDIKLDKNGVATITETWNANVNKGTEGWHPYYNLGNSNISVLSATMDDKNYTIEENWNESASLSEKAYKAGIYKADSNEYDIVFGISEYGVHTYKVVYQITNFVSNITDADIIYWNLFPQNFGLAPNNITIKISGLNNDSDTINMWVYGRKESIQKVKDGIIYVTSNGKPSSSEYITLLIKIPNGTFNTNSKINHDFNYYYDLANNGA